MCANHILKKPRLLSTKLEEEHKDGLVSDDEVVVDSPPNEFFIPAFLGQPTTPFDLLLS
jgi:hypothetical protein